MVQVPFFVIMFAPNDCRGGYSLKTLAVEICNKLDDTVTNNTILHLIVFPLVVTLR